MLDWEFKYSDWRAAAPLFGCIRVENWGDDKWMVSYSVPGFSDRLIKDDFYSAEQAKAAAQEYVANGIREFLRLHKKEQS